MVPVPPRWIVPRSGSASDPVAEGFPAPLALSDGSGPAEQATTVRLAWDDRALHVRFDCEDRDAWGTYRERNDPLYQEEVVEVFLSAGEADPTRYLELEVSPAGILFEASIHNPTGGRAGLEIDLSWHCPGLAWAAGPGTLRQDWWATLDIPWAPLLLSPAPALPRLWRANFYRIERPRDGAAEWSSWAPTWTRPAEFHRPACFGFLELAG